MAHVPAERCLAILELLADGAREMPLGEIAERLALPKSGAHRLLATLVDLGWAEQDAGTGFYRLTMRLAVLGQRFYVASGVPDICQPILDRRTRKAQPAACSTNRRRPPGQCLCSQRPPASHGWRRSRPRRRRSAW